MAYILVSLLKFIENLLYHNDNVIFHINLFFLGNSIENRIKLSIWAAYLYPAFSKNSLCEHAREEMHQYQRFVLWMYQF